MTRRQFLRDCALGAMAWTVPTVGIGAQGRPVTVAEAFDREVEAFMQARQVPGGALAVLKNGRLVYARGYGWADREKQIPVRPESLFRIASLSKPLTAVAVLRLVEAGRLDLDARAFELVKLEPLSSARARPDRRLAQITIRQLLHHTAGWDRDRSFDPMFRSREIARVAGEPPPAGPQAIIRYMLGRKLDFEPGTRYAYSNFGYCVLGRLIEAVSGLSYERFVQEKLLAPIGIRPMQLGRTRTAASGEVCYYMRDATQAESVFPGTPRKVPWPYGGFYLEAMDAHGGWIASVTDLARFAAALHDPDRSPWLKPAGWRTMHAPPPPPVSRTKAGALEAAYYGCGWSLRPVGTEGKASSWHTGSLPGTHALLVRRWDGLSWVALFNQRSEDKRLPDLALDPALHRAADAVTEWPEAE